MKTKGIEIYVITGPESSGKTFMANRLSEELGIKLVPEFARVYLETNGADYNFNDLVIIGKCQNVQEKDSHLRYPKIICDTDIITVDIWAEEVFGKSIGLPNNFQNQKHYLLCKPDIPWEPGPFRENPTDRSRLFEVYQNYLKTHKLSYEVLDEKARSSFSV